MQVKRIPALPSATSVDPGDYVLMYQAGVTKKVAVSLLSSTVSGATLAGLTDVDLAGLANGGLLTFDGTKWVPTNNAVNQIYDGGNF